MGGQSGRGGIEHRVAPRQSQQSPIVLLLLFSLVVVRSDVIRIEELFWRPFASSDIPIGIRRSPNTNERTTRGSAATHDDLEKRQQN